MLKTLENRINEEINYSKQQRFDIALLESHADQVIEIESLDLEIEDLKNLQKEITTLAKYLVINANEWERADKLIESEIIENKDLIREIEKGCFDES